MLHDTKEINDLEGLKLAVTHSPNASQNGRGLYFKLLYPTATKNYKYQTENCQFCLTKISTSNANYFSYSEN